MTLGEAAARTGLQLDMPIPIANYIIYNYITIKDQEIFLDDEVPPIDVNSKVTKIQSYYRSYLTRKRLHEQNLNVNTTLIAKDTVFVKGDKLMLQAHQTIKGNYRVESWVVSLNRNLELILDNDILERFEDMTPKQAFMDHIFPGITIKGKGGKYEIKLFLTPSANSSAIPSPSTSPLKRSIIGNLAKDDSSEEAQKYSIQLSPVVTPEKSPKQKKKASTQQKVSFLMPSDKEKTSPASLPRQSLEKFGSSSNETLLMKTGRKISGVYFITSLYRNSSGILVMARGMSHEIECQH